jgi:hypothetical protein
MNATALVVMLVPSFFVPASPVGSESLSTQERAALAAALADERRAHAEYLSVIERHGEVRPFVNIVSAEERHISHLLDLFDRYGLELPEAAGSPPESPNTETLQQACARAAAAEVDNAALYDGLLGDVSQDDLRSVFVALRDASRERHLRAFERCSRRSAGRELGCGRRRRAGRR